MICDLQDKWSVENEENIMARKKIESTLPHPLVATELGSHSVRSMAAENAENGLLRILGIEQSSRNCSVERGVVTSTSDASYGINESLRLLANRINYPMLTNTFVPLGGRMMKLAEVVSRRDQVHKREIPDELLDEMDAECKKKIELHNTHVAVLAAIPYCYVLDGVPQANPPSTEQRAAKIEVKYVVFVGPKELEQKVMDSFIRTPKHMERTYARPDALMCALASDTDFQEGCAILDMGAQTTTLTIFSKGKYVLNRVVAQGGFDITRDIQQMGVGAKLAEVLKCKYGSALLQPGTENQCFRLPNPMSEWESVVIRRGDLIATIEARLQQIMAPLWNDLRNYENQIRTIYLTGGAALLNGMVEYIQQFLSVPVALGSHAGWLTEDTPVEMRSPAYSALVGTLILGAFHREKHPDAEPMHDLRKQLEKFKKTAQTSLLDIFTEQPQ